MKHYQVISGLKVESNKKFKSFRKAKVYARRTCGMVYDIYTKELVYNGWR